MDKANVILLEVQPRNPVTGARTTIRLAGGGADYPYRYGGQNWEAGLAVIPAIGAMLDYQGTDLGVGAVPQALQLEWNGAADTTLNAKAALHWKDAPFTLWLFPENDTGTLPPAPLQVGKVLAHKVTDSVLQLAMADPAADLQRPLITDTFAGTGGLEGPAEWEGRRKRRVWGQAFDIEGEAIDPPNNVYCFGDPARPWQSFDQVRDKGAAAAALNILGWQGSVAATFAALQAAVAPQGGGVAAPSIAMVKWWTRPAGILAADVKGETTGGYVETAASIAQAMVQSRAGPGFVAGTVAAANAIRTRPCGYVADDTQATISAALDWLLGGVSLLWVLDAATGLIRIEPWAFTASAGTFQSDHADRVDAYAPIQQRKIGYRRNHRVHSAGDLAAIVTYGDGTPIDDYRPGEPGSTNGATIGVNVRLTNATVPTQGQVITAEGTAAAIAGQGALATQSGLALGGPYLTGFGGLAGRSAIRLGASDGYWSGLIDENNNYFVTNALAITALGTAAAIAGQGALATRSNARIGTEIVDEGGNYLPPEFVRNNFNQSGRGRVPYPAGGAWADNSSSVTGAIQIILPPTISQGFHTMVKFEVDIYNYVDGTAVTYQIGGYVYPTGPVWYSCTAKAVGSSAGARAVRFGRTGAGAGDKFCIWIGELASTWSYPQVQVRNFVSGYSSIDIANWQSGWVIGTAGSFPAVDFTVANPTASDAVFGVNTLEAWNGAAATLANFKTLLGTAAAISGQADWATYSGISTTNMAGRVQRLNSSDGRAADGRLLNSSNNFGLRALSETPTFSQTNAGSSVTLDLGSNGKLYSDWGTTITLPSATFTGLAYSTTYYVWRNMPPDSAGTSYGISTTLTDALGVGKVYLGFITTMTSGGSGGGGGGYGGGNCVAVDALVPISGDLVDLSPAGFVLPGDPLTVLCADLLDTTVTKCVANTEATNECVTLRTVSGITLTLALNTPMTLPGGFYELAANMAGKPVPVLDQGQFRWETVERVDYAGQRAVAQISCGNATYAAGDQPGRYIFSHNNVQKP